MDCKFNLKAFCKALDSERIARGINWKIISEESKVSKSTITRMRQGTMPDISTIFALAHWAGLGIDDFKVVSRNARQLLMPDFSGLTNIVLCIQQDEQLTEEYKEVLIGVVTGFYESFKEFVEGKAPDSGEKVS